MSDKGGISLRILIPLVAGLLLLAAFILVRQKSPGPEPEVENKSRVDNSRPEVTENRDKTAIPDLSTADGIEEPGESDSVPDDSPAEQTPVVLPSKKTFETDDRDDSIPDPTTSGDPVVDPDEIRAFIAAVVRPLTLSKKPLPSESPIALAVVPEKPEVVETESQPEPVLPPPPPPPDPIEPEASGDLVIHSPWIDSYYSSLVSVSGKAPGFSELKWRSSAMDSGGIIPLEEDGSFTFNVSTNRHSEDLDIVVWGINNSGESQEVALRLLNDGVGPSIDLISPISGDYYMDVVEVRGNVGPGPYDPEGIGEIASLLWSIGDDEPRPVIFGSEGEFSFRASMEDNDGFVNLTLIANDLNGNENRMILPLQDGRLAPELTLKSPTAGAVYGAGIQLVGSVLDPYGGVGAFGGIQSIRYEILAGDTLTRDGIFSGEIELESDGSFDLPVLTESLSGNQELTIIVTGFNGRETYRTISLMQGQSSIPDLMVESEDSSVLLKWGLVPSAEEYEVSVVDSEGRTVRHFVDRPSVILTGLENGIEYQFLVETEIESGRVSSHEIKAIPLSKNTLRPVVTGEFRRIRLAWDSVPGSEAYAIYRSDSADGRFNLIAEKVFGDNYSDTDVVFGRRYWYAVAPASYTEYLSSAVFGETLASQGSNVEQVGRIETIKPNSITIEGDYALIASKEFGLVIVDISEPARPVTVGRSDFSDAEDASVRGAYAYVASGTSGLKVVNIDDPTRPLLVGSKLAGDASAIDVSGNYAFIADRQRGLRVLDVSDELEPVRLAATDGFAGLDVRIFQNKAYLAAGLDGVRIFDISQPASLETIAVIPFKGAEVLLNKDSLLIVGGRNTGLAIFDISDPFLPRQLAKLENIDVLHLEYSDDFLIVTTPDTLQLVDIREPAEPYLFQTYPVKESTALAVHGDNLLIASVDGLQLYQTYLTGTSYITDEIQFGGRSFGISEKDDELFISSHTGGVTVVRAGDLEILKSYDTDFAEASASDSSRVFVADGSAGIRILKKDGSGEILAEEIGYTRDIVYLDSQLFAATESGLVVLNIVDNDISNLGTVPFPESRTVTSDGSLIYVGGNNLLRILAPVRDSLPMTIFETRITGIRGISVDDNVMAATGTEGVYIFDLTKRETPRNIGFIPMEDVETALISDRYLYLSAGYKGLLVYDIRRPGFPKLVTSCKDLFAIETVIVGNRALVVDGDGLKEVSLFIPPWLR